MPALKKKREREREAFKRKIHRIYRKYFLFCYELPCNTYSQGSVDIHWIQITVSDITYSVSINLQPMRSAVVVVS